MQMSKQALQHLIKQSNDIALNDVFAEEMIGEQLRKQQRTVNPDYTLRTVLSKSMNNLTHASTVALEANDRLAVFLAYGGDELQAIIERAKQDNFEQVASQLKSFSGEMLQAHLARTFLQLHPSLLVE